MRKHVYVPVAPEFKKKLKIESAECGMSVLEYTRKLAGSDDFKMEQRKKGGFRLGF